MLKRLAKATGGEAHLSGPSRDIAGICQRIARDIRNQYTIGYVPAASEASYRRIRVTVHSPQHGNLTARTRSDYMPPESRRE